MRAVFALALLVGCGGSASSTSKPEPLVFERYSPPQYTSSDVFVAAKGDVIALASRWSADGGATWQPSALGPIERAAIHGSTIVTFADGKLVRFDTASKMMTAVADTPAYANARNWRTTPSGKLLVADGIANSIAIETASGWTTAALPQPSPTEFDPYITDLESNGSTVMVVSAWGVYRSNGGAFERVVEQSAEQGRELVALADGRFVLLGGSSTLRFSTSGAPAGESEGIVVETGDAIGCDDGALVARGKVSRDAGGTWQPLVGGGDLTLTIERVGCGGGRYWVLGHNSAWGYRLLRFDDPAAAGTAVGNWELAGEPAWTSAGPPIVRTADGTLIAAGLAWREGDLGWTLRLVPARTWAAGDALFGVADGKFYTSADAGRTWKALDATTLDGEVEAFARSPDGALHVSRFEGESTAAADTWQSTVWRSADQGATWSVAYDAISTRVDGETTGEAHRFVGITESGAWIATDAISEDMGVTWTPTEFEGDKHLAFVTPDGYLVTPRDDLWRVYEAGGTGSLVGTWELEAEGQRVPASELRSVAFDELGHAYIARGAPYVQVWRSTQPIMRAP